MDTRKRRNRSAVILQMKTIIMGDVFANRNNYQRREMAELATSNASIRKLSVPTFMFMGQWYTYPYNSKLPRDTSGLNRTLDPRLYPEAMEIMSDNTSEGDEAKAHIESMIGNALQVCRTLDCLITLLPSGIWNVEEKVTTLVKKYYDVGSPLTPNEISQFKEQNEAGVLAVNRLYMLELLLGRG